MFTYGLELELADWKRNEIIIPSSLGFVDKNEISIVNSNGVASNPYDPNGLGGEIVTRVCDSIDDATNVVTDIFKILNKSYSINYSCWMHVHVGLKYNPTLEQLKMMLEYVRYNSINIRDYTEICPPRTHPYMTAEMRLRRNKTRTSVMSQHAFEHCLVAETEEEFWSWFGSRNLVNMVPLKYQNTVEFRSFYMTDSIDTIRSTLQFCTDFMVEATKDHEAEHERDVLTLLQDNFYTFPARSPFMLFLEQGYVKTQVLKQTKIDNLTGELWQG